MGELTSAEKRKRQICIVMIGASVLLLMDGFYQIGRGYQWRSWLAEAAPVSTIASTQTASQPATQASSSQPSDKESAAKAKPKKPPQVAAAIRRRNIFAKPKPKGHGMTLTGVLVDRALFRTRGNQVVGMQEGESGHGIKVKTIDGYAVTIEYQGKTETLNLVPGSGNSGLPSGGQRPAPVRSARSSVPAPGAGKPANQAGPAAAEARARRHAMRQFKARAGEAPSHSVHVGPDGESMIIVAEP